MLIKKLFLELVAISLFCSPALAVSAEKLYSIGDEIRKIYEPLAKQDGSILKMTWEPEQQLPISAAGYKIDKVWNVFIFGGLMFHPLMTEDGFRLVLCHEMGHIIGGEPTFTMLDDPKDRASNSGQPDYYAAAVCMKLLLKDADNTYFSSKNVDPILDLKCVKNFSSLPEQNLCRRIGTAGIGMANFLKVFYPKANPSFATPSSYVTQVMEAAHPEPQCRLDTFLAGALCAAKPQGTYLNEANDINALCNVGDSVRPRCWFTTLRF